MKSRVFPIFPLLLSLSGCGDGGNDSRRKINEARENLSNQTLLWAIAIIAFYAFGPSISDWTRKFLTNSFKLNPGALADLATKIWIALIIGVCLCVLFGPLSDAKIASIIMICGASHAFFEYYEPGIRTQNLHLRERGMAAIKTFVLALLVFGYMLYYFTADGPIGNLIKELG